MVVTMTQRPSDLFTEEDSASLNKPGACPWWPDCGCGTQSGPHTCEWKRSLNEQFPPNQSGEDLK